MAAPVMPVAGSVADAGAGRRVVAGSPDIQLASFIIDGQLAVVVAATAVDKAAGAVVAEGAAFQGQGDAAG